MEVESRREKGGRCVEGRIRKDEDEEGGSRISVCGVWVDSGGEKRGGEERTTTAEGGIGRPIYRREVRLNGGQGKCRAIGMLV